MKLSVATRLANLMPSVSLNRLYDFLHLHDTQRSRGALRSRDLGDTRSYHAKREEFSQLTEGRQPEPARHPPPTFLLLTRDRFFLPSDLRPLRLIVQQALASSRYQSERPDGTKPVERFAKSPRPLRSIAEASRRTVEPLQVVRHFARAPPRVKHERYVRHPSARKPSMNAAISSISRRSPSSASNSATSLRMASLR